MYKKKPIYIPDCPNIKNHAKGQPTWYEQRHQWAEKKSKTHTQVKCDYCWLFEVWIPILNDWKSILELHNMLKDEFIPYFDSVTPLDLLGSKLPL